MLRFLLRRLANYVLLLFIAVSVAYLLASVSMDPRNAFDWQNPSLNRDAVNATLTSYNINPDTSPLTRYGRWLKMVFGSWDWGFTPKGDSVNELLGTRIWVSLRLMTIGTLLGIICGVALGAWTAVRQYSFADRAVSFLALLLISTPVLVLAPSLQMVATWINTAVGYPLFEFIGETGQAGDYFGAKLVDRMQHLLLPTLSLSLMQMASYSRYQRNLMLDTLGADYVRTARAKGLRKGKAIRHHALRNAIIPMTTYFAFSVALVFTGAALTEKIYGWHGMGAYSVESITAQDINGTAAVVAFSGVCVLACALLSDILIAAIDPRVRTN
ncbi:ABC transporter permease [Luteococcus sp. Sow4_B9]|uniref:ABC transporter permease n=1 Tax=Luteococcus sp. Sow4_B9 TaxID=3438792 RepID=UPI003F986F31